MTNGIGHRVIAISRIFLNDQWKFLPWWLLSKSEYNGILCHTVKQNGILSLTVKQNGILSHTVKQNDIRVI